jgi:hypothetical protein
MKKLFLFFLLMITSLFAHIEEIKELQYIDPYGRQPTKYSEWCKKHLDRAQSTRIGKVFEKTLKEQLYVVDVIVNKGIYYDIETEINTFVNDLVIAGYSVQVDTISGMPDSQLRNHLAGIPNLVGAIFVGELPVAWFEFEEEFPHDIYFCDLDGTYIDADADGLYDDHTGDKEPEIWVGRIYARMLTWDNEIRLLKNYFSKNHEYRTSGSSLPERALTFIDDDWSSWTTCDLDSIYSEVVVINDYYQTIASNYRDQLAQGYEWIHICAHSSPWGHTFKYPSFQYRGTVFNYEIFTLEPQAHFYNLFACSGTRFTEENGSAGWYLFNDPYGLLVVGSTKTGSMLYFEDFYGPIGKQDMCIGDAFKSWLTIWAEMEPHGWSWTWFYGMNILGDPTLKPKSQIFDIDNYSDFFLANYSKDWESPETVAPDPEADGFPQITTNVDGNIWVTWQSGRSYDCGRSEIYGAYRDETDWSSAMNIGPHVYWDFDPDICIDHLDRPIVVWSGYDEGQYDLYYSVYDGSWSSRVLVHAIDSAYDKKPTMLRENDGYLWVAWESRRDLDLNIYVSVFDGASWSSPEQITTSSADEASPKMAIDSLGQPWIFYEKRYEEYSEIWGSYYTGISWQESGPISDIQKHCYHPACAVDEQGNIWVAWQSTDNGNPDIYANYFNGSVWSSPIQITTSSESDLFPDLTTDTSGVVWLVYQSKQAMDWNIYSSHCSSFTWSTPEIVALQGEADINPQITCDDENELWVCWQSYSTGNWEIMVSHQPGLSLTETKDEFVNSDFSAVPTVFAKSLRITTQKKNQEIKIYDVKGALVQSLSSDEHRSVVWYPKNISSGAYFVIIKDTNKYVTEKVLFLK